MLAFVVRPPRFGQLMARIALTAQKAVEDDRPMHNANRDASDMDRTNQKSARGETAPREPIGFQQLSILSGLSVSTLRRRLTDGSIHGKQVGGKGKKILFDPNDWEGPAPIEGAPSPLQEAEPPSPKPVKEPTESTPSWMKSAHYLGEAIAQKT